MSAVWMRARAEWRMRRRALVSATVLCGLFGAATLATLAGARRTETAYPRFLERQDAYDLLISDSSFFADVFWTPDFDRLARLPYVETSVRITAGFFEGDGDVPGSGGDLPEGGNFIGSRDPNFGRTINKPVIVKGRLPDPSKPLEVAVPYFGDRRTPTGKPGIGMFRTGDRKKIKLGGKLVTVTVVGETVVPGELPPSPQFGWGMLVTPGFLDRYARGCVPFTSSRTCGVLALDSMQVRFKDHADVARFDRDVKAMTGGKVLSPQEQASHARAVEGSTDLQASALRLLALFTALTGLMIIGQLLARETAFGASEASTLRALGLDRTQLFRLGVVRVVPVAIGGALLAVAVAWIGSSIFPRGSVRVVEPSLLAFDTSLLSLGGITIVLAVVLVVLVPAWRAAVAAAGARDHLSRPSKLAATSASLGLSVPMVAGGRLALERGRGSTAVPVISSLIVVAVGVASFVAASTVAGSLSAMIESPAVYGQTWDAVITTADDALFEQPAKQKALSARAGAALATDPDITAIAYVDSGAPTRVFAPGGPERGIAVLGLTVVNIKGSMFPPITQGRAPGRGNEVVLGARMIRALKLELDPANPPTIQVALDGAGDRRATVRVVGRAVIPPLGNFGELGYGILFGGDGEDVLGSMLDDPDSIPPQTDLIVRWRPGADPDEAIARNQKRFPQVRLGESLSGGKFADAVNFGGVQGAPLVVGGVLAGLGAAALAHVLTTAIRRRRRDIAILKTIGFVRGQARRAVAWQATITVLVAGLIGAPLGVVGGRWLWTRVANGIGVLPRPEVSLVVLLVLPVALVVLANVIAVLPARAAARTQPAVVLRSE